MASRNPASVPQSPPSRQPYTHESGSGDVPEEKHRFEPPAPLQMPPQQPMGLVHPYAAAQAGQLPHQHHPQPQGSPTSPDYAAAVHGNGSGNVANLNGGGQPRTPNSNSNNNSNAAHMMNINGRMMDPRMALPQLTIPPQGQQPMPHMIPSPQGVNLVSHPYLQYQQQLAQYQATQVNRPPPFYAVDVECVATGPKHNDRAVAQIAVVDQWERVVLNFYVKPDRKVFSYLTQITGLNEQLVSKGVDIATAAYMVRSTLPPNCILVGQNVLKDVNWLGLQEGQDFQGMQDLWGIWRVYNEKFKTFSYFSLHHQAKALLGIVQEPPHNAATDAILSIRLYNLYRQIQNSEVEMAKAHKALLETPVEASFAKSHPTYDGVCMGYKKTCQCGDPFFF